MEAHILNTLEESHVHHAKKCQCALHSKLHVVLDTTSGISRILIVGRPPEVMLPQQAEPEYTKNKCSNLFVCYMANYYSSIIKKLFCCHFRITTFNDDWSIAKGCDTPFSH